MHPSTIPQLPLLPCLFMHACVPCPALACLGVPWRALSCIPTFTTLPLFIPPCLHAGGTAAASSQAVATAVATATASAFASALAAVSGPCGCTTAGGPGPAPATAKPSPPPAGSPPAASPPAASPRAGSPPTASPPAASPRAGSPPVASPAPSGVLGGVTSVQSPPAASPTTAKWPCEGWTRQLCCDRWDGRATTCNDLGWVPPAHAHAMRPCIASSHASCQTTSMRMLHVASTPLARKQRPHSFAWPSSTPAPFAHRASGLRPSAHDPTCPPLHPPPPALNQPPPSHHPPPTLVCSGFLGARYSLVSTNPTTWRDRFVRVECFCP